MARDADFKYQINENFRNRCRFPAISSDDLHAGYPLSPPESI